MLRNNHPVVQIQAMNAEKKAYIATAIAKLNRYINEGRFDSELANHIIQTYPQYADTILLIYSGMLSHDGPFKSKSKECLKTLCRYYETGILKNTGFYKARAFLTYALKIEQNLEGDPTQKDFDLIATNIGKAIAFDNNYLEAKLSWCMFLERCGRLTEAKNNYEKLLTQHPDYHDTYHVYAVFLRKTGHKELAMQVRETLLKKFPDDIKALKSYALDVAIQLGDDEESIRLLQKALSLLGDSSDQDKKKFKGKIYHALGINYQNIGSFDDAKNAFQEADRLYPENAAVRSAKAHLKQNRGEKSNKHSGNMRDKLGKEFNQAMHLDSARFERNHFTGSSQTSSSVSLIEGKIAPRHFDYVELTAKLKFRKEMEDIEKELAALDERVYTCEEFKAISHSLEFAETFAMGTQFIAASKELNQARLQFLTKLKWINAVITKTLREFNPEKKELLPAYSSETASIVAAPKNMTARTAPSIAAPIELKQESLAVVALPAKVNNPKDKCFDLLEKLTQIRQGNENEFDNIFSDQLNVVDKLFAKKNYEMAQTKLLAILEYFESQRKPIKPIEERKELATTSSTTALIKTPQLEPKSSPQINSETIQKPQMKKNPATLFAVKNPPQQNSSLSLSTCALYLSLPVPALFFILYAVYNQVNSSPEQTHRFKI